MAKHAAAANPLVEEDADTPQVGSTDQSDGGVNVFDGSDEDNFTVDFGGVTEAKRELIPIGEYNVTISQGTFELSQSSGQPMWSIQAEIDDGPYAGRKLYTNISFSPKALPMSKGVVKVLLPHLAEGAFKPKELADGGELLGIHARVKVKHEPYQGEKQAKISRWMPATPSGGNAFITQ